MNNSLCAVNSAPSLDRRNSVDAEERPHGAGCSQRCSGSGERVRNQDKARHARGVRGEGGGPPCCQHGTGSLRQAPRHCQLVHSTSLLSRFPRPPPKTKADDGGSAAKVEGGGAWMVRERESCDLKHLIRLCRYDLGSCVVSRIDVSPPQPTSSFPCCLMLAEHVAQAGTCRSRNTYLQKDSS